MDTIPESFNFQKLRHCYLFNQINHKQLPLLLFGHLYTVSLSNTHGLTDVFGFRQVHTVIIAYCNELHDLSGLGNNKYVKIAHRSEVKDFQPLKTVFRVIIEGCSGYTESSHLSNVYHLSVIRCLNLRNVLGFAAVHHLELRHCPQLQISTPIGKVPIVEMFSFKGMKIDWEAAGNEKLVFWKTKLSAVDREIAVSTD
jgi:hypothetical protein